MKTEAEQGCHCGGVPPLGYDIDDTAHLVINEEEAEIVKLIFDMYELNYTYPKMAEILNERGYRNKRGAPFTKTSFERILKQEKYTGLYVWNRTKAKTVNPCATLIERKLRMSRFVFRVDALLLLQKNSFKELRN